MSKAITWNDDNTIQIEPPKRTKKITGTRFGAVLSVNPWKTPFEMWCEITKTYEEPFEDNIYTIAGKTIEPKQWEYMRTSYGMYNLTTPIDVYGENPFKKTYGNFFNNAIFGGMWDAILIDDNNKPIAVLEFKTSKRSEDWREDMPEYYALQAALYAHLLQVEDVIMVASFLEDKDYENPDSFVPSAANTIVRPFKLHERYPDFESMVTFAASWHDTYVIKGISPQYDEKKDADILKALRTTSFTPDTDIKAVLTEAEELKTQVDKAESKIKTAQKRLKELQNVIKDKMKASLTDDLDKATLDGTRYTWTLARNIRNSTKYDDKALKVDGLYDKYASVVAQPIYKLTVKERG